MLAPGWTDYGKRIAYQTYDVTAQLTDRDNTLEATLGDGWYCGYVGFGTTRDHYGTVPQFLAQLDIKYADGRRESVITDASWEAATSPILYSDMLMGESYDARVVSSDWLPVTVSDEPVGMVALVAQHDPPVRVTQDPPAQAVTESQPGVFVFDMGQNMVGWARLTLDAPAGTEIRLRFA